MGSASDQPPPGPDLAEGANGEPDAATNPAKDELLGQELDGEIEIDELDEEEVSDRPKTKIWPELRLGSLTSNLRHSG